MIVPSLIMQQQITPLSTVTATTYRTVQNRDLNPSTTYCNDSALNRLAKWLIHQGDLTNLAFGASLRACSKASALMPGKQIHSLSIKRGLASDIHIQSSLLTMYSSCGETEVAAHLFEIMPERDVVSWTAMIKSYLHSDQPELALATFQEMQIAGVEPDCFTVVSLISACACLGGLNLGRWIHAYVERRGFSMTVFIGTALVDMYCKCGSINDAVEVFKSMEEKNIQTWNAMVHGLGVHGHGAEAIELFKDMEADVRVCPNEVTFVAILCGCSHSGLLEEGQFYFDLMQRKYMIKPTIKHYGCMVDLLGRAGMLNEAYKMVTEMQIQPNLIVWGALLSACRNQNSVHMAERVLKKIDDLQEYCLHRDTSHFVIMSAMYTRAGLNDKTAKVRMKVGRKPTGSSWIEIGCDLHEFAVGRSSHPQWNKIQKMLVEMTREVGKENGRHEDIQSSHSEMVAVALGLLVTSAPAPIRITKNLRICGDCHDKIKSVSKIYRREIIVRDCSRFHQFKEGYCSCKDYW